MRMFGGGVNISYWGRICISHCGVPHHALSIIARTPIRKCACEPGVLGGLDTIPFSFIIAFLFDDGPCGQEAIRESLFFAYLGLSSNP